MVLRETNGAVHETTSFCRFSLVSWVGMFVGYCHGSILPKVVVLNICYFHPYSNGGRCPFRLIFFNWGWFNHQNAKMCEVFISDSLDSFVEGH